MDDSESAAISTSARVQYRAGLEALRDGRFEAGWQLHEARFNAGVAVTRPATTAPEWMGQDVVGKTVAVCMEQGFGDHLMFGRFLGALRARGADVVVLCHPKMARLFERIGYQTRIFVAERPFPLCDYWVAIGSLPLRLGVFFPPAPAYLPFPKGSGGGIGVVPTGNPEHPNDSQRSLDGDSTGRLLRLGQDLRPEATGCFDFSDTADLIANLDLIVSVDTSVAHLAASMGKPTCVLLPLRGLDWRWGDGISSPWYPEALLVRQSESGQWSTVLDHVETLTRKITIRPFLPAKLPDGPADPCEPPPGAVELSNARFPVPPLP